jgi:hypothetical protein
MELNLIGIFKLEREKLSFEIMITIFRKDTFSLSKDRNEDWTRKSKVAYGSCNLNNNLSTKIYNRVWVSNILL